MSSFMLSTDLDDFLSNFFGSHLGVSDYCFNGRQVHGKDRIFHLASAVTASHDAIMRAADMGADALLVHHGILWKGQTHKIAEPLRGRMKALLSTSMNLFSYHLPLDVHPTQGNNACLAKLLGLQQAGPAFHHEVQPDGILWQGTLSKPLTASELASKLESSLSFRPLFISPSQTKPIERVAFCSGAGQDYLVHAASLGADAFISGEISERTVHEAKEMGIYYFAAGHHATERAAIQELGEHVATTHGIKHTHINIPIPV